MTISATDMVVPVCFKTPLLCLLTQKTAQKFGYVLGIGNGVNHAAVEFILTCSVCFCANVVQLSA